MNRRYVLYGIIFVFIFSAGFSRDPTMVVVQADKDKLEPVFVVVSEPDTRPENLCVKKIGVYDNYGRYDYPANTMWEIEAEVDGACLEVDTFQYGILPHKFKEIVKVKTLDRGRKYDVVVESSYRLIVGQFVIVDGSDEFEIQQMEFPDIKTERTKEDCFIKLVLISRSYLYGEWSKPEYDPLPFFMHGDFDKYIYINCSDFEKIHQELNHRVLKVLRMSKSNLLENACKCNDERIPPGTPIHIGSPPESLNFGGFRDYSEENSRKPIVRRGTVICLAKVKNPKYD